MGSSPTTNANAAPTVGAKPTSRGPIVETLEQWAARRAPTLNVKAWIFANSGERDRQEEIDFAFRMLPKHLFVRHASAAAPVFAALLAHRDKVVEHCRFYGLVRGVTGKLWLVPQSKLNTMQYLGLHDGEQSLTAFGCEVSRTLGVARVMVVRHE